MSEKKEALLAETEEKEANKAEKNITKEEHSTVLDATGTDMEAVEESIVEKCLEEVAEPTGEENIERTEHLDENTDESNRKLRAARRGIRIAGVVIVMLSTISLAVMFGALLAMWSVGKNSSDLSLVANGTYVSVKASERIKELEDNSIEVSNTVISDDTSDAGDPIEGEELINEETDALNDKVEESAEGEAKGIGEQAEQGASVEDEESTAGEAEELANASDDTLDSGNEILGVDEIAADSTTADEGIPMPDHPIAYPDPNADYPLPFAPSGLDYFNDALFIGDSRMEGFGLYSGVPATFYAATGFQLHKYEKMKVVRTANGKVPIFDALPYDTFTKIYIKVGLNEMGCSSQEQFEAQYAELIARLREYEPRAIIYIHGLLPVTAEKSATDSTHNNANIVKRNEALKSFALSQKAYFLDVASAFADENGCLPSEMASDGIHLKSQYMDIWTSYLMSNTIVK